MTFGNTLHRPLLLLCAIFLGAASPPPATSCETCTPYRHLRAEITRFHFPVNGPPVWNITRYLPQPDPHHAWIQQPANDVSVVLANPNDARIIGSIILIGSSGDIRTVNDALALQPGFMASDGGGDLYVTTPRGDVIASIISSPLDTTRTYTGPSGLPPAAADEFALDASGTVWVLRTTSLRNGESERQLAVLTMIPDKKPYGPHDFVVAPVSTGAAKPVAFVQSAVGAYLMLANGQIIRLQRISSISPPAQPAPNSSRFPRLVAELTGIGPDGSIWYASFDAVSHTYPDGHQTFIRFKPIPRSIAHIPQPMPFSIGLDGSVYVSAHDGICRISIRDEVVCAQAPPGDLRGPHAVSYDGSLWYTKSPSYDPPREIIRLRFNVAPPPHELAGDYDLFATPADHRPLIGLALAGATLYFGEGGRGDQPFGGIGTVSAFSYPDSNSRPGPTCGIASGATDKVWYADCTTGLWMISIHQSEEFFALPHSGRAIALASAPRQNTWVVERYEKGGVLRDQLLEITDANVITGRRLLPGLADSLLAGADGHIYLRMTQGKILRVERNGLQAVARNVPHEFAVDSTGALWYRAGGKMRTSAGGKAPASPLPAAARWGRFSIAVGADGALWYSYPGRLCRSDKRSAQCVRLENDMAATALTPGKGGTLWFIASDHRIGHFLPTSGDASQQGGE